jgi:hypothetical protein
MKFIDGLKPEFKSPVLMQRPSTLDTAFVLAQLQEEVVEPYKKKEYPRSDSDFQQRHPFKSSLPLLAPPVKQTKLPAILAEDKRASNAARAQSADDRWRALRNYRRAKGLCQFCAEKWFKDHKCAETVQLHALQEMLELFNLEDDPEFMIEPFGNGDEQLFLTLSAATISGTPAPRTMCLLGTIQEQSVRILVDLEALTPSLVSSWLLS